ncbi:ferric iron reductase [Rhizobium sp. CF080]|nr:ferric iron reductase [Rhizobium sp. CF080]
MTDIADLTTLFTGPLAPHAGKFLLAKDRPPQMAGTDILDPWKLSELIESFGARHYPGGDRRAIASIWSKAHFSILMPPYLILSLVYDRIANVGLDEIGLSFGVHGDTQHLHLPDTGKPAGNVGTHDRFAGLMDQHIAPLANTLNRISSISRNVIWSNAGNSFELTLSKIEKAIGKSRGVVQARELLAIRQLPNRKANPLAEPVRYLKNEDVDCRQRRVCCARYLIPALSLCSSCPLPRRPDERGSS